MNGKSRVPRDNVQHHSPPLKTTAVDGTVLDILEALELFISRDTTASNVVSLL